MNQDPPGSLHYRLLMGSNASCMITEQCACATCHSRDTYCVSGWQNDIDEILYSPVILHITLNWNNAMGICNCTMNNILSTVYAWKHWTSFGSPVSSLPDRKTHVFSINSSGKLISNDIALVFVALEYIYEYRYITESLIWKSSDTLCDVKSGQWTEIPRDHFTTGFWWVLMRLVWSRNNTHAPRATQGTRIVFQVRQMISIFFHSLVSLNTIIY